MADKCIWTGASGKKYEYSIHLIGTTWKDEPGNYIFTKQSSPNTWEPIYIGETESLKERLPHHNELPCIIRNGGTHIHAHINRGDQARLDEESDLKANYTTPCN